MSKVTNFCVLLSTDIISLAYRVWLTDWLTDELTEWLTDLYGEKVIIIVMNGCGGGHSSSSVVVV